MHHPGLRLLFVQHKAVQRPQRQDARQLHQQLFRRAVGDIAPAVQRPGDHQLRRGELQPPLQRCIRQIIAGKNVHADALMHQRIAGHEPLHAGCVVFSQLGEKHGPVLRKFSLQEIALPQFSWRHLQKAPIVAAQHDHIQIIVPRNEALMPYRPQCGAGEEQIGDLVLFADPVHLAEHVQQDRLMLL